MVPEKRVAAETRVDESRCALCWVCRVCVLCGARTPRPTWGFVETTSLTIGFQTGQESDCQEVGLAPPLSVETLLEVSRLLMGADRWCGTETI
jgi:hypothetical protein